MINVFKHLAPAYGNILRKYAIKLWYGHADESNFLDAAARYKKRYERELIRHYKSLGYPYDPKMIKKLSDEWLADQIFIAQKLNSVIFKKKEDIAQELNELVKEKRIEVKQLLSDKHEGRIASVVSFETNMDARARQMGEDAAFDLSTKINHAVVSNISDVYIWKTQKDSHVRKTHRKLADKLFSFLDPPTTIDKYGNEHTGNPGTEWGCRCWEEAATGKPLKNYIVRA